MMKIPIIGAMQQSQMTNAGEAKLFFPLHTYVKVSEGRGEMSDGVRDFIASILPKLKKYSLTPSPELIITVPYSIDFISVQKAVLVAVCTSVLGVKDKKNVHTVVYELEKDIFGIKANAQTVAAVYDEIFFFRKEFEFYRTMVKLPMKLPKEFLDVIRVEETEGVEHVDNVEKRIRRLVYSISTENIELFKEVVGEGLIVDEIYEKQLVLQV